MKKNKTLIILAALALILFAGSFSVAQETKAADESSVAGMTPEMMAKWVEMSTPTDNHKALDGMIGTWTAVSKWWGAPDTEPMVSNGTCTNNWVLDGRWVMTTYKGDMMGQPFEGLGYMGYDNYKQKYVSTWMDSMSTMVMFAEGTMKDGQCIMTAEFDDFMTGKKTSMREVIRVIDDDHHVMEMYGPAPDGTEFLTMEITYTRQ